MKSVRHSWYGYCHCNPYSRIPLLAHPRVIRDGERNADRIAGIQMARDDAPTERLRDGIGSNEAKTAHLSIAYRTRGLVPPVHHEVGRFRHLSRAEQRVEVAVAQ